jgi:hypothetical protein
MGAKASRATSNKMMQYFVCLIRKRLLERFLSPCKLLLTGGLIPWNFSYRCWEAQLPFQTGREFGKGLKIQ